MQNCPWILVINTEPTCLLDWTLIMKTLILMSFCDFCRPLGSYLENRKGHSILHIFTVKLNPTRALNIHFSVLRKLEEHHHDTPPSGQIRRLTRDSFSPNVSLLLSLSPKYKQCRTLGRQTDIARGRNKPFDIFFQYQWRCHPLRQCHLFARSMTPRYAVLPHSCVLLGAWVGVQHSNMTG